MNEDDPQKTADAFVKKAKVFRHFTRKNDLPRALKLELCDLLNKHSLNGMLALETTELEMITRKEATVILKPLERMTADL